MNLSTEYPWDVAKAVYGAPGGLAEKWAETRCNQLECGDLDAVLTAMRKHGNKQVAVACINYIANNRSRMQYHLFRQLGLCVVSGVLEAGCRNATGVRLERGGMRWTVEGANTIIALRRCVLNGRFKDF